MNLESLIAENTLLNQEIAILKHELAELRRLIFGSKSERFTPTIPPVNQMSLFDVDQQEPSVAEVETEQITYERIKQNKSHPGRNEIPAHFPVEETVIEPEGDTTDMMKIGEEVTEYVEYTPGSLRKIRIIRPKYANKNAEGPLLIAPLPVRALPKSIAGVSLIAHIIVRKFVEHMPFYRQIQAFDRDYQWQIPSSTINDWFVSVCTMLEPLYDLLKQKVLESGYMQVDESPIQVLDKNTKKGSSHKGYQWVYHSPEEKLLFFDYHTGRDMAGPKQVLADYTGLLQSDGYNVYDALAKQKAIIIAACLVHVRRYFYKARDNDKKRAEHALNIFSCIYKEESKYKNLPPQQRKEQREQNIKPLLVDLKAWVEEQSVYVTPQSPIGKAMAYMQSQWPKIMELFNNGRYELDNNLIENKIRPLALGRRNYLFAGSHDGAQRIAMMYSFLGSCAANGINPGKWLENTLEKINDTKINNLAQLLPTKPKQ
jgi:transposase